MVTRFGDADGSADEQTMAYLNARAKGGVGLIISPPFSPTRSILGVGPKMYYLFTQQHIIGASLMVEQVHHFGAKIFMQTITGGGRWSLTEGTPPEVDFGVADTATIGGASVSRVPFIAQTLDVMPAKEVKEYERRGLPIPFQIPWPTLPREATIEEIWSWENDFAKAAELAKFCGFDGLQIHCCHGGPIWCFLSPRTNLRIDIYGGSLENRMRHLKNCYKKAREAGGEDFPISVRLSFEDQVPGGHTIEETKLVAKEMERFGVDLLDFDNGTYESFKYMEPDEDDANLPLAAEMKSVVKVPITTCSVHDPDIAERAIKEGKTDMVSLGRQLLCDPEWPNKVAKGARFVKCLRDNIGCYGRIREGLPLEVYTKPGAWL